MDLVGPWKSLFFFSPESREKFLRVLVERDEVGSVEKTELRMCRHEHLHTDIIVAEVHGVTVDIEDIPPIACQRVDDSASLSENYAGFHELDFSEQERS